MASKKLKKSTAKTASARAAKPTERKFAVAKGRGTDPARVRAILKGLDET